MQSLWCLTVLARCEGQSGMGSVFSPLLWGAVSSHLCVLSVTSEHLFVARSFYPQHTYVVRRDIILILQTGSSAWRSQVLPRRLYWSRALPQLGWVLAQHPVQRICDP